MELFTVDAFTDKPFTGNPAGVCFLDGPRDTAWMGAVAREMNLSETAFLLREGTNWRLRWFTPRVEVDLCGHATLATAHVLREKGVLRPGETVRFHTRSGELSASAEEGRIVLDFPAKEIEACPPPEGLLEALEISDPLFVGKNIFDYLVEVGSDAQVRSLAPDFPRLAHLEARGTMVTARSSESGFDCVSRFFAPRVGVPEDPVTGSAHCALGPYWGAKLGKTRISAFQASERGGAMEVVLVLPRVLLKGQAVTVLRGHLEA
ncbi:MAG TPA: PhzF family phenazine biosynthesis protein [Synergistaceae bacterium]|nr:PhzF family phenazine biosynthesis protein [Synergistaceae bacterium]HQF91103.1 PhzF family phenazine biosynthesis protein [Synergistaceae bacterium]HQH79008.1 PhzF family phenazine biosynthesis protein [Synergistaceae bacterium]HQK25455.1 PhzF family phenazine biosynthesis protein [Synergistaceae bacterium]